MTHELNADDAAIAGVAGRISAAEKAEMALQAGPAVMRATVHVTRAATGKVETFELVGAAEPPQEKPE